MIKFFRKHNKRLLVIVTILAMVSFVGGSALKAILSPDRSGERIATAYGHDILEGDRREVENQTRLLDSLGYNWRAPWGQLAARLEPLEVLDYLLLLREAREAGVRPSREQARAQLQQRGVDLNRFSLRTKASTDDIITATANFLTVVQLWSIAQQSMLASELEVRQAVRDQHEKIGAEIVEIDAAMLVDPDAELSESELLAHYEKYREQPRGQGPHDYGYLVPDQVRVEYVKIDTSKVELRQPITRKQAENYWREHKAQFLRPKPEELEGPQLPPQASDSPYYDTFDEAQGMVMQYLVELAKLEEGRRMAALIWEALRAPWYSRPLDDSGFRTPPEGAGDESYCRTVIDNLGNQIKHPQAIEYGRTGLFAPADAAMQFPIGQASVDTQSGARGNPFGSDLHLVQGLVDPQIAAANRGSVLTVYEPAPTTLIDENNNLYIYRVIEVVPERAPASLDEVREAVVADVLQAKAFAAAKQLAEGIESAATQLPLEQAWNAFTGLDAEIKANCCCYFKAEPFPKLGSEFVPGFRFPVTVRPQPGSSDANQQAPTEIRSDEFVADVYKLRESAGDQAMGVIEEPTLDKCFVVRLTGIEHVARTDYDTFAKRIRDQVNRSRLAVLQQEWFQQGRIRARTQFEITS